MYYNEARYNVLTETGPEPVSIDDVKFQLNMRFDTTTDYDFNDDDTFIAMLIRLSLHLEVNLPQISPAVS